jgi:hypothetical protein
MHRGLGPDDGSDGNRLGALPCLGLQVLELAEEFLRVSIPVALGKSLRLTTASVALKTLRLR